MKFLITSRRLVPLIAAIFCACAPDLLLCHAADLRVWTDKTGKFKKAATLDGLDGDEVILAMADDSKKRIPLDRLSDTDQQYVRDVIALKDADKTTLIEELLRLTKQEDQTRVGQLEGFKAGLGMAGGSLSEPKKTRLIEEAEKAMAEIMPWSAVKKDLVAIYDKAFSEEELRSIIALCRDPRFSAYIDKQISLVGPAMQVSQQYGVKLMPRLTEAAQRVMQE